MKTKSIIAAVVLSTLSLSAFAADTKFKSGDKKTEVTIHESTVRYGFNNKDEFLAQAWVSVRTGNDLIRNEYAVGGCADTQGKFGRVDDDNSIINQRTWFADGDSVGDNMATHICLIAFKKLKAEAEPSKVSSKSGI